MRLFVLDASAWVCLFVHDSAVHRALEEAAAAVDAGKASFAAPELILVEAGHALHCKRQRRVLSDDELTALWSDMRRTPIDLVGHGEHMEAALALAQDHHLTVYDALYLAVAAHLGAPLLTLDARLARAAQRAGLAT